MEDLIELRKGWWWPKVDREAWNAIKVEVNEIDDIITFVKGRETVIQAGGNCGMWPAKYATIFKNVYTFEPDPLNLFCLKKNITADNIKIFPYAVGEVQRNISMEIRWDVNRGANRVILNGETPMIKIDDLNVNSCDLLQLDIEGFEHQAVLGAVETIKKFKPTIVLELKGHGEHYGVSDAETIDFVKSLGYTLEKVIRTDHIFVPKND
jgi:FkbM family methyltransferase